MSTVIKVGGSLFQLPHLASLLRTFLNSVPDPTIMLFPGGGPAADVIRTYDRCHALGNEASHWLSVEMLTVNAHFLATLLPELPIVTGPIQQGRAIIDPHAFALIDEKGPGCPPHTWDVTSDSLAARAALLCGASELVLLKSVALPVGKDWVEASRQGLVDDYFPAVLKQAPALKTRWLNFRACSGD